MNVGLSFARPGIWAPHKIISLWVRTTVGPPDIGQRLAGHKRPVCYVLERQGLADLLVLQDTCVSLGLPRPSRRLLAGSVSERRSVCYLERSVGWCGNRIDRRPPELLARLVTAASEDPTLDVDIVPVALYWGRAPQKEGSWFRLMLGETWEFAGRFRRFLTVLFNGRSTLIQFGEPLALRTFIQDGLESSRAVRRLSRVLRGLFRAQRAAAIGPDLSHRRTIVTRVLATRAVRAAVAQEMRAKNLSRHEALLVAKRYADEIAANYSHVFITILARLLARFWNRLYDGVVLDNEQILHQVAEGNEIIYVPCHRSHMDYLLLSYVIYVKGFAVPHIAAGINLNMPVLGRFLRKGGAFFMRRSFRGDSLYTTVFMKYLGVMMARGHSLEYFIEGGRSRTGRLLEPKTGMLSMTVRSYLREPARPVVFLPVYFGYERLVEGDTYIGELSGRPKKKESVWGLLRSLSRLKHKFGKVHVSLGEPIRLTDVIRKHHPEWSAKPMGDDSRPAWLNAVIDDLARQVMVNINAAAAITPVTLLAMTLLATPRQAMLESDLIRQLDLYRALMSASPYSPQVTLSDLNGAAIVRHGERMGVIERLAHPLGDVLRMGEESAILQTYFRNNILHLFSMPSLMACCFLNNNVMQTADLLRLVWRIYPYIADELYLHWREDQIPELVREILTQLAALQLIDGNSDGTEWRRRPPMARESMQLSVLAQGTIQIVERYYIAIALLVQAGSGAISQEALERRCHLMAQRMSMLFELNSPEFFDKTLFASFIDLLRRRGVVQVSADNRLLFSEVLLNVANDAQLVLSEQIRRSILQVTHA